MIRMSKYHIAILQICLCALFLCQGGRAEMCPPETLHVNFEAREIAKNVQFSIFGNDSVIPYIERYLQHWRGNVDAVEVVNAPPYSNTTKNNYYTYDNDYLSKRVDDSVLTPELEVRSRIWDALLTFGWRF